MSEMFPDTSAKFFDLQERTASMVVLHGVTIFRSELRVRVEVDPLWIEPAAPSHWREIDWSLIALWGLGGGAYGLLISLAGAFR